VGQYIQSRGGVVAAEELAPYLDVSAGALADAREGAFVDEGYVVPALVRFGGQPEVGPDGELLYRFPSLQRTARAQVRARQPSSCRANEGLPLSCRAVDDEPHSCLHPGRVVLDAERCTPALVAALQRTAPAAWHAWRAAGWACLEACLGAWLGGRLVQCDEQGRAVSASQWHT